MNKIKVAITGGIGAGKSLVSNYFLNEGFPVLFSDEIAKDLMQNDVDVVKLIKHEFGDNSYNNGKLNTKYLSEIIFNNDENVDKINAIVHPIVVEKINELTVKLFQQHNIVFVEIPLLFESELEDHFDFIILVYSDEKLRISRTIERSKLTEDEVKKRMLFQIPDENKKDKVDFVIDNNSSIQDLENRAKLVLMLLKEIAKQK
ncbi:MAG: dephospho-CoA kinase [Melioribacteraceae bacterium]|nr:dephospho-CoA kinase [Melioribacteraceae bacterium]